MKMKLMVPLLKKSSDVLVEKLGEFAESGKSVEMFRVYGAFTMETLIATAFGRHVNIQRGEADQITQGANSIFRAAEDGSPNAPDVLMALLSTFPWLEQLVVQVLLRMEISSSLKLINSTAISLIQARIESKEPPQGFSIDFLLAGYETTANTLSFTTYLLAMNPDVQEKLQAEIDQYFEEDPEASLYEAAQKLKYLDMVIHESMRLLHTRTKYGDSSQPRQRRIDPSCSHAVGWGLLATCIGLRFALLETKIALMEILRKYSFARGPETPAQLEQAYASHLHRKAECLSRLYQESTTISSLRAAHTCTKV
ncbi:Cytochrome P450 3A14 [Geodia barretti]|uniref:Cytochrome P450 3A14 n=1 Tax=Geodia barretti TaxID=519541 RepID=A0AA35WGR1_GEOBA|nr:Cytochrome P450 3A14 [Geodia barretti]